MFTNEKRLIVKYSQESLKCALMEVRNGTSTILVASKMYGIPRSTIQDRIHGQMVQRLSKVWIPIKAQGLINTVKAIVVDHQRATPFLNGPQEESGIWDF